ncbi:Ribosomal protein L11 methyltransferase [Perkinsela sp. CCAP 1560/4]|nr:Ribosomal protein L11 methyltransferase [Perkinsela sp. CCAP 1560/4]|eukprot:KNH03889.1 Ribosomal protein L11 methyltransferase [Perkinsela sp. CCAP 1560/4]
MSALLQTYELDVWHERFHFRKGHHLTIESSDTPSILQNSRPVPLELHLPVFRFTLHVLCEERQPSRQYAKCRLHMANFVLKWTEPASPNGKRHSLNSTVPIHIQYNTSVGKTHLGSHSRHLKKTLTFQGVQALDGAQGAS